MAKPKIHKSREERIDDEIIVDCYGEAERAMGWYYYLEDRLAFSFTAKCIAIRSIPPLSPARVEVVGMAPEEECEHEMFVTIRWEKRKFGVPLSQLEAFKVSRETKEAVEDPALFNPGASGCRRGSTGAIGCRWDMRFERI